MKVHIRHPNGAQFTGSHRHAEAWWQRFDKATTDPEPEPTPSGSHAYFSSERTRYYDDETFYKETPVVFAQARKIGFSIE